MKNQGRSIRQILKSLLSLNNKRYWLYEGEVITTYSPKIIQLVKKYAVIIEVTSFHDDDYREHKMYRLKTTSENMSRAKELLKALS